MFVNTLDILVALKTVIAAIQLPPAFSAVSDYPTAFKAVEIYGSQNIEQAFEDMYAYEDRACFIVPTGDRDEEEPHGRSFTIKRETDIALLVADRNFAGQNLGLIGEAGSNPGLLVLKELVNTAVAGQQLNLPNVLLRSNGGTPMTLTDPQKKNDPGRFVWGLDYKTSAGTMSIVRNR